MTYSREMLERWFPGDIRMQRTMEAQQSDVAGVTNGLQTTALATEKIEQASVLVLAGNNAFENERVLVLGDGLAGIDDGRNLTLKTSVIVPKVTGGFSVVFVAVGNSQVRIPLGGTLATVGNPETLSNKTLAAPLVSGLGDYADDAAAATGGVAVGGLYRTGSALKVRVA